MFKAQAYLLEIILHVRFKGIRSCFKQSRYTNNLRFNNMLSSACNRSFLGLQWLTSSLKSG